MVHKRKKKLKRIMALNSDPNKILHLSKEEATMLKKPYINGYSIKTGIHGDIKYNRRTEKKELKRILNEEQ